MKTINILQFFFNFGVHIGQKENKVKSLYYDKLVGFYKGRAIINILSTFNSLKKVLVMLKMKRYKLLFHISNLFLFSYEEKAAFINLIYFKYKQGILDQYWFSGYLTRWVDISLLFINIFFMSSKKNIKIVKFMDLLFNTFFFIKNKRLFSLTLIQYLSKVKRYWRIFVAFKFLRNYVLFPDSFIILNGLSSSSPSKEMNYHGVPVIGTVDTELITDMAYPIYCNDKNILFLLFLSKILLNNLK